MVGWSIADHMRTELVTDALQNAAETTRIEPEAIWHSDRGSVYTSTAFRALVTGLGMRSSIDRTRVCWDNSLAESFFAALKNERVYRTVYATKSQAKQDVIGYIEGFYNSRRRHSALDYRRPAHVKFLRQFGFFLVMRRGVPGRGYGPKGRATSTPSSEVVHARPPHRSRKTMVRSASSTRPMPRTKLCSGG